MKHEIIDYLNSKVGTKYRHGTKKADSLISARINEGATLDDFKKAIDNKTADWSGTEQEKYLRPETLFGTKFWGYVNETKTDITKSTDRRQLIKAVLKAAGIRDIGESDITIYSEVLKMIPTESLPAFAVSLIRSGGEYMRPDQMISKAVKEFETKIITDNMRNGKKIRNYEKLVEFVQYSFRGKPICNDIKGIYKAWVTIGMDRDGNLINQFSWNKLSSKDEEEFYKWLFENQHRVGDIKRVKDREEITQIENNSQQNEIENGSVLNMTKTAIKRF